MRINTIAFAGNPVTDIERTRNFYQGALGFKIAKEMTVETGSSTRLVVTRLRLRMSAINGGHQIKEPLLRSKWKTSSRGFRRCEINASDSPLSRLKRGCHMAVVQDADGNKLMIHKLKPEKEEEV
jgi:hypothetical protein